MSSKSSLAGRLTAALRHPTIRVPLIGNLEEKAVKTHLLCAIALGLAGTATAASAQTGPASSDFYINSSVAAFCSALTAAPGTLDLGAMLDADGRVVDTFVNTPKYSLPAYYCNMPATMQFSAAPLVKANPGTYDNTVFTNRIDYQANLAWGTKTNADLSLTADVASIANTQAHIGTLELSFSEPETAGDIRPIAGTYNGSVTLTLVINP